MSRQENLADYCQQNILNIPQDLFGVRDVKPMLHGEESSIFYKDLESSLTNVEFHTSVPCIIYIKSGQEIITTSQDEILKIQAGEAILLPKGLNLFSDYIYKGTGLIGYLLFLGQDVLSDFVSTQTTPNTAITNDDAIYKISANHAVKAYFKSLHAQYEFFGNSPDLLRTKLLELLYLIDINDDGSLRKSLLAVQRGGVKRNIRRLMDQYAISTLSVKEIAGLSGRSITVFNRDFKLLYGRTPKQWLIDQRMAHAHTLLSKYFWSVTAVATELGYNNVSHFISAFKSKYGETPHQVKQKI
jgi:AraC-like DNA-binding protein